MRVIGWETCSRNEGERARACFCAPSVRYDTAWLRRRRCSTGRLGLYPWYDPEHTCRDPKDGELCLSKMKPGETLVEV